MKTSFFHLLSLFFLTGCMCDNLYVQSTYITHRDLASFHVHSPDPRKDCPDIGQRLLVHWSLPSSATDADDIVLRLHMRYGNQEEKMLVKNIEQSSGVFIYELLNEEFMNRDGIQSYLAEIVADGEIIEKWVHQIWTDRIDFSDDEGDEGGEGDEEEI